MIIDYRSVIGVSRYHELVVLYYLFRQKNMKVYKSLILLYTNNLFKMIYIMSYNVIVNFWSSSM